MCPPSEWSHMQVCLYKTEAIFTSIERNLSITTQTPFAPNHFSFHTLRLSSIFLRTVLQVGLVRKESR